MLIQNKEKYICFSILLLKILCYTGSLFCTIPDIQKNRLTEKYTNYFYHSDNDDNKITSKNDNQFSLNTDKKSQLADYLVSGKSSLWSNAFNFKKAWGTTVDSRTGILSTWVKAGSMLSNLGHGPDINLNVSYSSSTLANPDGLGRGWSWNLTHFDLATHQLITSFGQNFYLKKQFNGHWQPMYHKLHDILIQGDISTHFVITYANGLRETLNHEGYETHLEQQDGWSVHFSYLSGTHLLNSVKDDRGHIIRLHRKNNYIKVISQGSYGQNVVVLICKKNSEIHGITLPFFNNHADHGIYFYYARHFINSIDYPTGLKNRISYNCNDEIKIPKNYTLSVHALCAVIKEITDPGFGQPIMVNRYRYGKTNINEHNYMGFNVGFNITTNSSKDRLFEAPVSYTYQTEQDNGLIREVRTYNKYHLMTDEQQVSDRTGHILSAVHYFFCRTDQYDGCAHSSFADLPATYSLPLKIITRIFGETTDISATTTMTTRYDKQGRIIWQKDIYGRVTINSYCPLNGDDSCPAASTEWPFTTLNKFTVQYPADSGIKTSPLLPVITRNYYRKEIDHNGKGYIAVLDHQTAQSGNQQITTTRYYYQNTEDLLTYGLLKQIVMTGQLNETNSHDAVIKDYYYIKSPDNSTKTTYSAVELSESKRLFSSYITTSLFTNQVLMVSDAEKKDKNRYRYDPWDRLVRTERAVGTNFTASTYYSYTISKNHNQVLITAVNGLQKKIIFDSSGRALKSFTEAIDKAGNQRPGRWWPVQKFHYDQYGDIERQSSYIVDKSGHPETLDTTWEYDDTGRAVRMHLPDGRMNIMHYDDSDRCVISYQQNRQGEHAVISVSRANVLSKPIKQWILPATNTLSSSVKSFCLNSDKQSEARISLVTYDGFGRQIKEQDPEGRIVKQYYDSMGRLTDIIDPSGNRTHSVYNLTGQTIQSWVYPVSGEHYLLSSAGYNRAGQLIWHAGEDGKHTVYTYTPDGQIATITTPNQHIFCWQYNQLNLPISQSIDNKQQSYINYDAITLRIQKKTDITGIKTYFYSDDGLTKQLIFNGNNNYHDYKLQWQYDNNRRIVSSTDISGSSTRIQYDQLGRVARITYYPYQNNHTEILSSFAYDDFSRIKQINYGSGMQRIFYYDLWGHKDKITDTLRKQLISQWQMTYDINNNIIMLSQKAEEKQTGIQHYHYDVMNNLVNMQCEGSFGLPLCPHDTLIAGSQLIQAPVITRQNYTFTPLNRLASVLETLQTVRQKTIRKVIHYRYTDKSVPLRLQSISTRWSKKQTVTQNFTYDNVGNMTVDAQNNHITYNTLNQVTRVISLTGNQSDYSYDGSGQEIMEKSRYGISYLFYCDGTLINERMTSPEQDTHINGYLGVAKTTDGMISEYYENSYKGDVSGILRKNNVDQYQFQQRNIYSPYGMVWHKKLKIRPLYQQTLQGFGGERTDAATGWQFLGAGNRTYNPGQRYFLSEDPVGDGYAFGSNNPIMNTDPSGNSPRWLGEVFKWTDYISTMGLGALHQRWVNITAAVMQAGCTVATLGAAVAGAGSAALAGVVAGTVAVGSVPIVAAAIPANKGLNIAGKIIGMAEMVVSVAAAAISLTPFVAEEEAIETGSVKIRIPLRMLSSKLSQPNSTMPELEEENLISNMGYFASTVGLAPPLPEPDTCVSAFLKMSFDYYECQGTGYLNLNTHNALERTWKFLCVSPFASNVECDTGTILLAYHVTKTSLRVEMLEAFLYTRNYCYGNNVDLSFNNDYISALTAIFNPVKCHDTFLNWGCYDGNKLNFITLIDYYTVIIGSNHMTLIQKFNSIYVHENMWKAYVFYSDGSIGVQTLLTKELSRILPNPVTKKFQFYGYLRLKSSNL